MSINMEVSCYNISWLIKSVILTTENFRWITKNMINQSYEELILFNNNDAIHQRHWRYFALEVFKCLMHLNPVFLWSYINRNSIACTSRSVLVPVLFNLYLNDLFHFADFAEVCNFADDTTISCLWQWSKQLEQEIKARRFFSNWMVWNQ